MSSVSSTGLRSSDRVPSVIGTEIMQYSTLTDKAKFIQILKDPEYREFTDQMMAIARARGEPIEWL